MTNTRSNVRVAHEPGERPRSYQGRTHSGGQGAKISILFLLAAMIVEGAGSTDLLFMDEHVAHLDSNNIDKIAEALTALKHRVQFFLAIPTTAEAGRADWADHQLVFYRRDPGEAYAAPIRAMTRLPEDGERYAEMDQLGLAV